MKVVAEFTSTNCLQTHASYEDTCKPELQPMVSHARNVSKERSERKKGMLKMSTRPCVEEPIPHKNYLPQGPPREARTTQ